MPCKVAFVVFSVRSLSDFAICGREKLVLSGGLATHFANGVCKTSDSQTRSALRNAKQPAERDPMLKELSQLPAATNASFLIKEHEGSAR
jgi:hypothetical protein